MEVTPVCMHVISSKLLELISMTFSFEGCRTKCQKSKFNFGLYQENMINTLHEFQIQFKKQLTVPHI